MVEGLALDACWNRTYGDHCSFAAALNTVRHGKCSEAGTTNDSKVVCVELSSNRPSDDFGDGGSAFDPHCSRARLHSHSGACCPLQCDVCSLGRVNIPDACSVEFILRLGPSCASSPPPCVVSQTQGAPHVGFLLPYTPSQSVETAAAVTTSGNFNPGALDDMNDAAPAIAIGAIITLCVCLWCCFLICRASRENYQDKPLAKTRSKRVGEASKPRQDAADGGRTKKKKKKRRKSEDELDGVMQNEAGSDIFDTVDTDVHADDDVCDMRLRIFADSDVVGPVPIVDIWNTAAKSHGDDDDTLAKRGLSGEAHVTGSVPIVDIWQDGAEQREPDANNAKPKVKRKVNTLTIDIDDSEPAAPAELPVMCKTSADTIVLDPSAVAASDTDAQQTKKRKSSRRKHRNPRSKDDGDAQQFHVESDDEKFLEDRALASMLGSSGHRSTEQINHGTPRVANSSGDGRADPGTSVSPAVVDDKRKQAESAKELAWHRKWDDMETDLSLALDVDDDTSPIKWHPTTPTNQLRPTTPTNLVR